MQTSENKAALTKSAGYFFVFIGLGLSLSIIGPTLPGLSQIVGRPIEDLGIIFTAREVGIMFTAILGARFYDRVPGHYLLAGGLFTAAILLCIIPLAPSLPLMSGLFIVLGVGLGLLDIGCNTLLIWVHGEKVSPYMNSLHFFFGIGAFIAPIVVALVTQATGTVKLAYWILALVMIPAALNILRMPSPVHPHKVDANGQNVKPNIAMILLIAFFLAMYVGAEVAFGGWISTYVLIQNLANEASAAYLASVFWGAFTFGRLAGIPTAARISPDRLLYLCLLGSALSLGLLVLVPGSMVIIYISTFGFGFFIGPIFATMMAMMGRVMHVTGRTTGWIFVGAGVGSMTIPWGVGRLIALYGPQAVIYCAGVPLLVGIIILSSILALQRKQPALA